MKVGCKLNRKVKDIITALIVILFLIVLASIWGIYGVSKGWW